MFTCCLTLLALAALPAGADAASASHARATSSMVKKVNAVRARHGLRRLRATPGLRRGSQRHAHNLMARDRLVHHSLAGGRGLGEAIAFYTGRRRVSSVLGLWLRSPPHRALLLKRSSRIVGVGAQRGRFRGRSAVIWVLRVAHR